MLGLPVEDPGGRTLGARARMDQWPSVPQRPAAELHRLVWGWRYTVSKGELEGALADVGGETVRVLASSLSEVEDARRVECADGPLWLVKMEPVSEAAATRASAPAPATR